MLKQFLSGAILKGLHMFLNRHVAYDGWICKEKGDPWLRVQGTFRVPEPTASLPLATPLHQQPRHCQCRAGMEQPVPSGWMSPKRGGFRLSSTLTAFPTAAHTSNPAPHSPTAWSLPANSKLLSLRSGDLLERQGNSKDGEEYIDTGFVLGKLCHPIKFYKVLCLRPAGCSDNNDRWGLLQSGAHFLNWEIWGCTCCISTKLSWKCYYKGLSHHLPFLGPKPQSLSSS